MKITFRRRRPEPGTPEFYSEIWPTYIVLMDGREIGTVKQIDHSRLHDTWHAYDLTGKMVCEALRRQHAATGLADQVT